MPDAKGTTHQDPSKVPNPIPKKPPDKIDLTGCTFEGKKLSAAELEERERHSEFMEAHRKEVEGNLVILRRRHQSAKGTPEETRRVAKRKKTFTANEIRKEYGIMQKPYGTKIENIIWCIVNKGPIDMKGMAAEMGMTDDKAASRSLSGPLSHLYRCLGTSNARTPLLSTNSQRTQASTRKPYGINWIVRLPEGGRYFYSMTGDGLDKSVEVIYGKYRTISNKINADKIAKKKNVKDLKVKPVETKIEKDIPPIPPAAGVTIDLESIEEVIKDSVQKAAKRILGVQVTVNGKVEILFGFKKN